MEVDELYQLIVNPARMSERTLVGLKHIIDEYPYFQTARILYLKNLAILNDIRFISELKRMSVFIQDRKKLFAYVEGDKYGLCLIRGKEVEQKNDKFGLIDSFLFLYENNVPNDEQDISKMLPSSSVSSDYIQTLSVLETSENNKTQLYRQDLIDSFIDEESLRSRVNLNNEQSSEFTIRPNLDNDTLTTLEESSFSETLARIYVKQKRYEKAKQIIQKLSLKYPEKNGYFADQVRFLEKLIINTKK